MSKKHKNVRMVLNHTEHLFQFLQLLDAFQYLLLHLWLVFLQELSSIAGLEICIITAVIKKYQSIIKKKKNNHDKTAQLVKTKLNSIEVLIFKALADLVIMNLFQ